MVLISSPVMYETGGMLFIRDLLRPPTKDVLDNLVARYAGDANPHQRQLFADSLHAALTLEEVRALLASLGFDAETVQQTSDRHWTWIGVRDTEDEARAVCTNNFVSEGITNRRLTWVEADSGVWLASAGDRAYRVLRSR